MEYGYNFCLIRNITLFITCIYVSIEHALHRTSECLSVSHKECLDMTKRRVCYEIVTRSSVVIRATVSTAKRARFAALHFPVAFLGNPSRLYYARIGNVPEKPGLAGSRKRRMTGRTWDARGLSSFSSGPVRPEGLDRSTRPSFSRQRGQRPSSGRAFAAIISRGANRRATRRTKWCIRARVMSVCTCTYVRARVYASVHEILSLVSRPADTFTRC